jgi:hypothetical protein
MISERLMNRAILVCVVAMVVLLVLVVALNAGSGGLVVPNSARPAFANTNLAAPFSAMGFLAASAGLLFAIIVIAWALAAGQRLVARAMLIVAGAGVALYATALLGFSLQSRGAQLAPGVEKYFCELDCHLAYTVTDVRTQNTMPSPAGEQRAAGVFYVVTLRTRFDPTTIAPWRGDAPLRPNPRRAEVVDAAGRRYPLRSLQGTDLMTMLRPGESYTTRLIFDLPQGVREPCLLLTTPGTFPEPLLIGDENSPLHKKVSFRL